jgi:hypothetical protein
LATHFADTIASRRRNRRRALAALLMASAIATVGAGAMSLAVFTDTQASAGSWTAGTIKLGVSPATTFTATNILPGDTGSQTVTVSNVGTGALRYAMTSVSTNTDLKGLAAQMTLTIKVGACPSAGATLYTGSLSGALFGDPTQGQQTNDQIIAAAANQSLCFTWLFPLASANSFQSAATSTTFTFAAEQTQNN